ncbi:MAG TPA: hypothetical protein VNC22_18195 [Sporichthya sp.]|nr:hypothetical protein [Sporichthya sp.]
MATDSDAPSGDDRPVAALAGQFLHQRAAFRTPRPGGRIDELDALDTSGEAGENPDATRPDHSEEDEAG